MNNKYILLIATLLCINITPIFAHTPLEITWDSIGLRINNQRVMPVMGEIHYSRLPQNEWQTELQKMKNGGVTIIATYVFWNHVEEEEGIFNWSGQRDLRTFLEACREENLPVILRVGPFCHGEVRNGGIPDWVFQKGCKTRNNNPQFMEYVRKLYRQIFTQIQGLQAKDGGPVIAAQFDNEQRDGTYLMALKKIALEVGFDLPFYTRTGWPALTRPVPYGEMIPLYGDYADGFWDRSIREGVGDYYKAFRFRAFRTSTAIATEQLGQQTEETERGEGAYPYFTCELGGGMATAYHRRPYIYPEDAYAMAVVKLGSGSNLLGYYMYHGGTNPEGTTYLNECQRTVATNYNDLPVKTYDFQAPLGEFGQYHSSYFLLRKLHLMMQDYGAMLAEMPATFPAVQEGARGEDGALRWSYRMQGDSGMVFVNNYERLQPLSEKSGVRFHVGDVTFPSTEMTIPAGTTCIFPVCLDGMRYATAQPIARRDGRVYLEQIPGIDTEIQLSNGKLLKHLRAKGTKRPVYKNIYLLTSEQAEHLFLPDSIGEATVRGTIDFQKIKEPDAAMRKITIGVQKVAEEPVDSDFVHAAVYRIPLDSTLIQTSALLRICYRGDVARLYANGRLVADNFYNGRPLLYRLTRLPHPEQVKELELRILPLQENMPVYFPREATVTPGESLETVEWE
jgi:hypothetical protein